MMGVAALISTTLTNSEARSDAAVRWIEAKVLVTVNLPELGGPDHPSADAIKIAGSVPI